MSNEYHVFVIVFNPCRGNVESFMGSVFARDMKEARRDAKKICEPGETPIIRLKPRK